MNYNEMRPTFWNYVTLIDLNFGTKSQMTSNKQYYNAEILKFPIML